MFDGNSLSCKGTMHDVHPVNPVKEERSETVKFFPGEHGVVVRAFSLYLGGSRFESLSTHYCWDSSKSFILSLVVWSVTNNNAFGGEKQKQKSNGEQSDLFCPEQVTLKPQLQAHHCLTTWLQNMVP